MKGKNVVKKIICIALVLIMLAGNLVNPIASIAKEIENAANNDSSYSENNGANADNNNSEVMEEENNKENGANLEGIAAVDSHANSENVAEASNETTQENANEDTKASENAEPNEEQAQPAEENSLTEATDETKKEVQAEEESTKTDDATISNTGKQLKKGPSTRALGANNQALGGNNTASNTSENPNDIKERLQPLTKENFEVKTKNDEYEIRAFQMQFLSGANLDDEDNLVWTPTNTAAGHEFTFRINYALSGLKELPPESIKITIPKSIIRNRNKNLDDKFIMSLPTNEEWDGTTEFAYIENEDYLVIYNPKEVPAGINGYIEVAYATKSTTFNYKDYDKTNTGLVKDDGTASDPFYATIAVTAGEDTLTNITNEENIFIDTTAKILSTQKRYPTIYKNWNSSWMAQVPADADDYYYLVWEISSNINAPTQAYNFSIDDFVTDLTEGTTGEDYELVGYKLAGERYYSNNNTQTNQTISGIRYDYVLTRHKKSTYTGIKYALKNTETATVDPIDQVDDDTSAKSQNMFYWDPSFVPPTGHFELYKFGNNNGFNGKYSNYDLEKLQNNEVNELTNFRYKTETVGYAYPWTLKDGGSSGNPEDYGYNNVNYETWDDTLNLEEDETPVNYEDYYLQNISYTITNKDVTFDEFYQRFDQVSPTYEDNEEIIFYGKFNGGDEWVQIATYNLKTKATTPNNEYVASMTTSQITFKPGVHATGWRFTTSNKHYYTDIIVIPHYVITNSQYVAEKIAGKDVIRLQNKVNTEITDHNNQKIFERERIAIDYARVTYYDSQITKIVSSTSNNVVKKRYNITWKVNAWEKATGGSGEAEYIEQESGKFYDLIPLGGILDTTSIQVQTNEGFLRDNEYSYEVIQNYNNSGRAMLVITMDKKADWYTAYYKTVHSWNSIKDFGTYVLNPVSYETGNEKITKGYPDNGGNLSDENKVLYTNLDSETDDKKFIYAERSYDINALTATTSGLYKKVKNSKEEDYSYDTQVEAGGNYSYQLRYQNTFTNKAKNLVFLDSIENFKIVNTEEGTTKTSGWKGTLQSIDLTQLRKKGIDPVVYISTQEDLDLEIYNDLTDTTIWKEVTLFTDLTEAKAIAIDMRKDKAGNDFVLDSGDSVNVTLHMSAPESITEEQERNPYTYNNIYLKNTLIDELAGEQDFYIHQDYTRVKYYIIADVPIRKVNAKDTTEGIANITFRLYGTSVYGTEVDEYIASNSRGDINFKDIEVGEYILQEYEASTDWFEDHTEHRVRVTGDKKVFIDDVQVTKLTPFIVTNEPRIHTDVTIYKKDLVNHNKAVEGAKFKLAGTSDYGNEILMYGISDENGKVTFEDIEKGTYELTEISTAEGYTLNEYNKEKFRVIVDENGNYDVLKYWKTSEIREKRRYSHTSNIDDSGYALNGDTGERVNDLVTIPGASSLNVTVYYGTYTSYYDFVCVFDSSVETPRYPYDNSISGKLGSGVYDYNTINASGYEEVCEKWSGVIEGDTVQFYYEGSFGAYFSGECYGYYAIITATVLDEEEGYESIYNNGRYEIYNEPLHNFSFTKKDLIDRNVAVPGVTFKVNGTSDYGTYYEKTAISNEVGKVAFDGLEKGTYTLTEIDTPSNYVLNTETYTVTIDKMNNFTISGSHMDTAENGVYNIYNEPKHNFYFTKKDKYNNGNLGGATFKLYGTSNIGNTYDEEATSVQGTGIVTFDNLESGTYFLKEIEKPDTEEVTYVLDERKKTVEVFENGRVTLDGEVIWPLSERNENDPFIWYNIRNKGQITITKKWADNLTNGQREEPKIYISTKRGEHAYSKVYFRTADNTHSIIDYVTSGSAIAFKRNLKLSEQEVLAKNPTRLDNDYANNNAEYKIYAWEENGIVYWWTKADRAVLPANLDYYFQNEEGLTELNWSTIYRNGFWTGIPGSEAIQQSVTNMQNMFYGCTSMKNLDISIINNSEITEETKANMQYVFGNNGENSVGAMKALKYITIGGNFKLFDTSILPIGKWENQITNEKTQNISLIGDIPVGTYEKIIPIKVGDTVKYSPSGTYYWNAEYATSYESTNRFYREADKTLYSGEGGAFRITEWKVLNVDNETGNIEIVPTSAGLSERNVTIQGPQGYNNGVYLLNEACSNLYSDESKGITARNINIDDIENILKEEGEGSLILEPSQISGTYNLYYSKYPVIYGQEKLSTINSSGTLGLSEQTRLIERSEGTSSSYIGAIDSSTNMPAPYNTVYELDYYTLTTVLGDRLNILLPNDRNTYYWVASRCVSGGSAYSIFGLRWIEAPGLYYSNLFRSDGITDGYNRGLFPVVSMNADILSETVDDGVFEVN